MESSFQNKQRDLSSTTENPLIILYWTRSDMESGHRVLLVEEAEVRQSAVIHLHKLPPPGHLHHHKTEVAAAIQGVSVKQQAAIIEHQHPLLLHRQYLHIMHPVIIQWVRQLYQVNIQCQQGEVAVVWGLILVVP